MSWRKDTENIIEKQGESLGELWQHLHAIREYLGVTWDREPGKIVLKKKSRKAKDATPKISWCRFY